LLSIGLPGQAGPRTGGMAKISPKLVVANPVDLHRAVSGHHAAGCPGHFPAAARTRQHDW
jgi:hypothetical protein